MATIIYNDNILINNHKFLDSLFPKVRIFYTVKANRTKSVLDTLVNLQSNFFVNSINDFHLLKEMGISSNRILFGEKLPALRQNDINKVSNLEIDSPISAPLISKIPALQKVLFRVHTPLEMQNGKKGMKWGLLEKELALLLNNYKDALANLSIGIGIHCSNNNLSKCSVTIDMLIKHFRKLLLLFEKTGLKVSFIDLGGSIDWRGELATEALQLFYSQFKCQEIWIEPGSFLVQDAFKILCSVMDIRQRNGKPWIYLDISIYDGLLDIILQENPLKFYFTKSQTGDMMEAQVVGYTSDTIDDFGIYLVPVNIKKGSKFQILSTGAYFFDLMTSFGRGRRFLPIKNNNKTK